MSGPRSGIAENVPASSADWVAHAASLAALVPRSAHPVGGFGWLSPDNRLAVDRGVETWITCRMTHVAALAVLREDPASDIAALRKCLDIGHAALGAGGLLHDPVHGGWFTGVSADGANVTSLDDNKAAYAHAFVILAAASLTAAGHDGGRVLLDSALAVFDEHFWDETVGMSREQWDRSWTVCEEYRGVNANMHTVEAMLAAGDVLGDDSLIVRATRVVERVVEGLAADADWRLPEHFDGDWTPVLAYNRSRPADQFRPYGVTIGHVLEWARLAINTAEALRLRGQPRQSLVAAAQAMFDAAVTRGWFVDGAPGFVYTTDFEDRPVVRERLHWVVCEGFATACALDRATGEVKYGEWMQVFWAYARQHLIDPAHAGWFHELSPDNGPSSSIWWGKPDIYHAYQAMVVPSLPGMVSFAGAQSRRKSTPADQNSGR